MTLVAATLVAGGHQAARADASTATVTFTSSGEHAWSVPEGVTRVDILAIGGEGAASSDRHGGLAARIQGTLDVTPGQTLYAEVGSSASGTTPGTNGGGAAGGPGCFGTPGAGGGATDVRTVPLDQPGSAESRVLVAGGGGGAGTWGSDGQTQPSNNLSVLYGGHRGMGGGGLTRGGYPGKAGVGGHGGAGGLTEGTATDGGRGDVGTSGDACGGGGGGGYGGGGAGASAPDGADSGGGGGGGSLVPGGFPAGMAARGEQPSVTFSTPGVPAAAGPLSVTAVQTFKQNDQGGGINTFANCPSSCNWVDGDWSTAPGHIGGDIGYANTQRWGSAGLTDPDFNQSFVSERPTPPGSPADLGVPFLLTNFAHYNVPIRGDSPTALGLQSLVTVQPPAGPPAVFSLRGSKSIALDFIETDNNPPCDPSLQVTGTPCDDAWRLAGNDTATAAAAGVTWHLAVLGWRTAQGTFTRQISTEERHVSQRDLYAEVTLDTNATTSTLAVDDTDPATPVLTMTTTPVPQTGGTVTFTDGGTAIPGCTDVPVDTTTGAASCTPSDPSEGTHTYAGSFSGSLGYAASDAAPVDYIVPTTDRSTTTTLTATPNPSTLNQAVTLTATVSGTNPTGTVSFHIDGGAASLATSVLLDGQASAPVLLPGGNHTVVATYSGDESNDPSTSEPTTDVAVQCDQTVSGHLAHALLVTNGTSCITPGTRIDGAVIVGPGASVDVEGASVKGGLVAASPNQVRMCGSTAGFIWVSRATGFVMIGDPDHGCAPNTDTGWLIATGNTGGLVAIDNTVGGTVFASGNSGAGPLPGQEEPVVSGNHR